jgi:hypothetical protein
MVDSVRSRGIGALPPADRDNIRNTDERFVVDYGASPQIQRARLAAATAIGLEGMLALQSVDEAVERDRSARKRGTAMIAALTDLQRAMLGGDDPSAALRSLSELAVDTPLADDPKLAAILREVVLRSRVEVALRARSGN